MGSTTGQHLRLEVRVHEGGGDLLKSWDLTKGGILQGTRHCQQNPICSLALYNKKCVDFKQGYQDIPGILRAKIPAPSFAFAFNSTSRTASVFFSTRAFALASPNRTQRENLPAARLLPLKKMCDMCSPVCTLVTSE